MGPARQIRLANLLAAAILVVAPYRLGVDAFSIQISPASAIAQSPSGGNGGGPGDGNDGGSGAGNAAGNGAGNPAGSSGRDSGSAGANPGGRSGDAPGNSGDNRGGKSPSSRSGESVGFGVGSAIEVQHHNGMRETVSQGRYVMRDARGRVIVDRRATGSDYARMRTLVD